MASLVCAGSWGCGGGNKATGLGGSGGAAGSAQDGGSGSGGSGTGGAGSGGADAGGDGSGGTTDSGTTEVGGSGGTNVDSGDGGGDIGAGDAGMGDANGEVGAGITYAGCMFVGGINRFVIAKRDMQRNLCVVLVLDSPGANPFNLTLPQNWGMEFAFAMAAQPTCVLRFPPAGSVAASGGMGMVTLPLTSRPTADLDVTLTFPPADAGAGASERLTANGVLGPNCQ
jgi:hypothetical protein